jgi:hypothetical protein
MGQPAHSVAATRCQWIALFELYQIFRDRQFPLRLSAPLCVHFGLLGLNADHDR